jgi:hypothetical protein
MRTINDHIINPANDRISITVTDDPGQGGANHAYLVSWGREKTQAEISGVQPDTSRSDVYINFQNGPIADFGVNGVTQEVLLAIVIDRLRSFQKGPYACRENDVALTKLEESLMWLQRRTIERMRRGVEGTNTI